MSELVEKEIDVYVNTQLPIDYIFDKVSKMFKDGEDKPSLNFSPIADHLNEALKRKYPKEKLKISKKTLLDKVVDKLRKLIVEKDLDYKVSYTTKQCQIHFKEDAQEEVSEEE